MPKLGFSTQEYFSSRFQAGGFTDEGPIDVVGRGGSPGCVTRGEFRAARIGMTRQNVHQRWDTTGHFRLRMGSTENRGYRICQVRGSNIFAEFTRRADGIYYLTSKKAIAQ